MLIIVKYIYIRADYSSYVHHKKERWFLSSQYANYIFNTINSNQYIIQKENFSHYRQKTPEQLTQLPLTAVCIIGFS